MTSRVAARLQSPMIRTLRAGFMSVLALVGASAGARAQFAFEDEVLPPRVVAWRLADRGFSGLSRPRFDGRVYVVEAVSPTGMPLRLFVDPGSGRIIGRQRLGTPDTYARLERPAPGFGWTEEDIGPRRAIRPIPGEAVPALRLDHRSPGVAARPEADFEGLNPDAVNPDDVGRRAPSRRVARTAPTRSPEPRATHRTSPEAPVPRIAPSEAVKVAPKTDPATETKSAAIDKAPAASPAPQPQDTGKPAAAVAEAEKPAAKEWKDPPADRKAVRVIGGATIVPGAAEKEPAAAQ